MSPPSPMLRFAVCWRKRSYGTVSDKGNRWAERANKVADEVHTELTDILMVVSRPPEEDANRIPTREFPPLFAQLRCALDEINASLSAIEETMSGVDL